MAITLDLITLPNDLEWTDEFSFSYIQQNYKITLGGTLIVEERELTNSRPITLTGGDKYGHATRAMVEALYLKVNTIADVMTLTLHDGRVFSVMWRREGAPMVAIPIDVYPNPKQTDLYQITLNFVEV